ncbi:hypothetical protein [Photobacterium damselae]|uniref:hypothetical protein n=1 Tax=Photobacterium damselae TaxID=38293 RepID=UPI0010FD70C1|nr:hypothetical protein [Photobacterium damselae]TLS70673.1 hypothetical protein FD718_05935 [Photobacterium damselae subsp. damselae]
MKKIITFVLLSACSLSVNAKVTNADVDRDMAWLAAQNNHTQGDPCVSADGTHLTDGCLEEPPIEDENNRKWYSVSFVNNRSYKNNKNYEIVVNAKGGNRISGHNNDQNNRCQLSIIVDGREVASNSNNNDAYGKSCFVSATVPAGSHYSITSNPWGSTGSYSTQVLILK